jgi:hypothetical protein
MAERTIMDMFADMGKQFNLPKIDTRPCSKNNRQNIDTLQRSALAFSQDCHAFLARH